MSKSFFFRVCLFVMCLFGQITLFAQDTPTVSQSMEEVLRSNDKIYVVMAVCLLILIVLLLYIVSIDRKITRKERQG